MDYISVFEKLKGEFSRSKYADVMRNTVENSPWHREANVWVHTCMTIDQHTDIMHTQLKYDSLERFIGAITLLYHDVGKPSAEETIVTAEKTYRRYSGHEGESACTFIDHYMTNKFGLKDILSVQQAMAIRMMIENHLPYQYKDKAKINIVLANIKNSLKQIGLEFGAFFDILRGDAWGRISDDREIKLQNVENWIAEHSSFEYEIYEPDISKTLFIISAESGAGKSTFIKNLLKNNAQIKTTNNIVVIEQDQLRIDVFKQHNPDYENSDVIKYYEVAWEWCHKNPEGSKIYHSAYQKAVNTAFTTADYIIVDEMNITRKARREILDKAKRHNFNTIAFQIWVPQDVILMRRVSRPDKRVPHNAVRSFGPSRQQMVSGSEVHCVYDVIQVN